MGLRSRGEERTIHERAKSAGETGEKAPRDRGLAALWLIAAMALCMGLAGNIGNRALSAHEIFAAQTAREMVQSGDWINPTYNGLSRLKKPPLMYWLQGGVSVGVSGMARALGFAGGRAVEPWEARLPSALAGAVIAACTVLLGRRIFDGATGTSAGLVVMACLGFVEYGRSARPDMVYGACCAVALVGWVFAVMNEQRGKRRTLESLMGWAGAGAATLAKGPHVPAIFFVGVAVSLLLSGQRREVVRRLRPWTGMAIAAAMCAPWVIAIVARSDEAVSVWGRQLFAGRAGEDELSVLAWLNPFYLYMIPMLVLPWAVALPFGLFVSFEKGRPDLARGRVLAWVVLVMVGVMSLSNHRRDYYMLPILAPLAVLMARGSADWLERMLGRDGFGGRMIAGMIGVFAALACALAWRSATIGTENIAWILEACGAAALAALVAPAWHSGACTAGECRAHGIVRIASAGTIIVFLATAGDPITRDRYTEQAQRFAQRVDEIAGPGESGRPIVLYRMPDAGVVYAQVVYTLDRVIPEASSAEEVEAHADEAGRVWAVLRMNHLDEVAAKWATVVETDMPSDDPGEPRIALVRCEVRR